ncbi:NDR1/HIN1-like protein 10 [Durio zibethinus]|uniref:NDR1/HIN1-like protein 10 n=1 Tax=Durio zibethinus TaxID=66656 RepID=A0A6P5ZKR0_DURZI|nr:NDR1/HIN1-like protein 10 [Durio zibethinus]
MLSSSPPPVFPPPPPPLKQTIPVPLDRIVISKPVINQQAPASEKTDLDTHNSRGVRKSILLHPRRTNPLIWCCAILCLIFSLILILFGVATLIIFLSIKPRIPAFDTPNASLSGIYFDSPEYFNGDFTFLVNFSNPNHRIDVRFEYLIIELYFHDSLISSQAVQPFSQRRREARVETVHFISSLVYLPQNLGVELQKQIMSNKVNYNIRGTFKVRANLGLIHFSYWLHSRCELVMSSPPTGVLVSHSCKTRR